MTLNPKDTQVLVRKPEFTLNPVFCYQVRLWSNAEQSETIVSLTAPLLRANELFTLRQVWRFTKPNSTYVPVEVLKRTYTETSFEDWQQQNPKLSQILGVKNV